MRRHWDLIAEMGASAIVGAYVWWMHHLDAAGLTEAKRLVACAAQGVVDSIQADDPGEVRTLSANV